MINYTRKLQMECKRRKITEQEKAFADLIVAGWTAMDAYIAMGYNNPILADDYHKAKLDELLVDHDIRDYIDYKKRSIHNNLKAKIKEAVSDGIEEEEEDEVKLLSKEEVLQETLRSAMALPVNDMNRIKMLMAYAELQQMKREEVKEEDTTIHYYLPLSCNQCSLYIANKKKQKSGA